MAVERVALAPELSVSRMIKGGWQVSAGHSPSRSDDPIADMFAFADAQVTTFDCADIYTGVEELIGQFLSARKKRMGSATDIQVLTKFVPDYDALRGLNRRYVEKVIDRSLGRLGVECLDMVQFSWWSYEIPGYVEAANYLADFQKAGKIRLVSGTNFNTEVVKEIVLSGTPLRTLQVQYSILDPRPANMLESLCIEKGIDLLCYGTVAGGFLSDRWLGAPEPKQPLETRSLIKYKLMIDEFGSWEDFQKLLRTLRAVADRHQTSIANIAMRWVLEQPTVAAIIVGARSAEKLAENLKVFDFKLDPDDHKMIRGATSARNGPPGDVFDIERIKDGPHGSIMRYNLNQV